MSVWQKGGVESSNCVKVKQGVYFAAGWKMGVRFVELKRELNRRPHFLVLLSSKYSLYSQHMEFSYVEVEMMFIAWRWERGANGKGTCTIARSPQRGNSPVHNFGGISILT